MINREASLQGRSSVDNLPRSNNLTPIMTLSEEGDRVGGMGKPRLLIGSRLIRAHNDIHDSQHVEYRPHLCPSTYLFHSQNSNLKHLIFHSGFFCTTPAHKFRRRNQQLARRLPSPTDFHPIQSDTETLWSRGPHPSKC